MIFAGTQVPGYDALPVFPLLVGLVALFTVGERMPPSRSVAGPLLAFPVFALIAALVDDFAFTDLLITPFFAIAVWGAGFLLRRSRGQGRTITTQAVVFAEERAAQAREAVTVERARIARELHDAVAQNVSVMVLQLGALRQQLGEERNAERELLLGLEQTGRHAVVELRRLLGILRDSGTEFGVVPAPSMSRLAELVAAARSRGVEATLTVEGHASRLAPGLDLSAYRIVQEALNNVEKHAPGAAVTVTVSYSRGELVLRIHNDAPGRALVGGEVWPGHGLIGMRERAELFGGQLRAGWMDGGGFEVEACLPIESEVPQ
jgi:signal transduction histidine kinase